MAIRGYSLCKIQYLLGKIISFENNLPAICYAKNWTISISYKKHESWLKNSKTLKNGIHSVWERLELP